MSRLTRKLIFGLWILICPALAHLSNPYSSFTHYATCQVMKMKDQPLPTAKNPVIIMDIFYVYAIGDLFPDEKKSGRWWLPNPISIPYVEIANSSLKIPTYVQAENSDKNNTDFTDQVNNNYQNADDKFDANNQNGNDQANSNDGNRRLLIDDLYNTKTKSKRLLINNDPHKITITNNKRFTSDPIIDDEAFEDPFDNQSNIDNFQDAIKDSQSITANSDDETKEANTEDNQNDFTEMFNHLSVSDEVGWTKTLMNDIFENYVEMVLLDAAHFEEFKGHPCCSSQDIQSEDPWCSGGDAISNSLGKARLPPNSGSLSLSIEKTESSPRETIVNTKAYYLLLVACMAQPEESTLEGSIIVRNSFGFLPGNLYKSMDFYHGLMIVFFMLLALWVFIMFRQRTNLIPFHFFVGLILCLGLIHTSLKFSYYSSWNYTGDRSTFRLIMSILSYIALNGASFILILVASLGWGVTKPHLDKRTVRNIQIFIFIYIIVESSRLSISEIGKLNNASTWLIILLILPSSITYFVIVFWTFNSLIGLLSELERNRQFEKLRIFRKLMICLLIAVTIGTIAALIGNYIITMPFWKNWTFLWIFEDLTPSLIFLCVVVFIMFIWRPNQKSKRLAYFIEIREIDDFDDIEKWSDSSSYDESDEELYTERNDSVSNNTVQPIVIGRPSLSPNRSKPDVAPSSAPIEMGTFKKQVELKKA